MSGQGQSAVKMHGTMSHNLLPTNLGEPDLKIVGFQLWVHGRQFPDSKSYYDGNWLRVTAHCGAQRASVWAQGAILMVTDIAYFGEKCAAMLSGNKEPVAMEPLEPELRVTLEPTDNLGHVSAHVEITPDHLSQEHRFVFEIDQSYLPDIIRACLKIVQEYPIRGL